MARLRLGVLVSGSGSNLQALLDACGDPAYPAGVAVVIANVPGAFALERAREAQIPTHVLEHRAFEGREAFDRALVERLREHGVELVCLAGFMRLLTPGFLRAFEGRVVNIHPALLPAFPGLHGPRQALAHGVKLAGCTVHFVDEGTDSGPIIVQATVPVLEGDDEEALTRRILAEEHRCYPYAVRLIAEGRVRVEGRRVRVQGEPVMGELSLRNPGER